MYEQLDMLNVGDKDLIAEFVYRSMGRVLNRDVDHWNKPIPQGCSVFMAHPGTKTIEYMFTKDEKYPVVKDDLEEVTELLHRYGSLEKGGVILYLNSCMMKVYSRHQQFTF